jgi:hypothetical protein
MDEMTPEMLQQWMELAGLDDQQQRAQHAMELATAIRPHSTGWGAALDGLGGVIGGVAGGVRTGQIGNKQKDARLSYAKMLADALGRRKVEESAYGAGGPSAMGDYMAFPGMG